MTLPSPLLIRPERDVDVAAIRELTARAFGASEFGHQGEADLVDHIRASHSDFLSLVAEQGDDLVGHILFSPVELRGPHGITSGMGLAPMAVDPPRQRQGVGSRLVDEGLQRLRATSCAFVVVLGHVGFYQRFGFRPAEQFGVRHGFEGIAQDYFLYRPLTTASEMIAGEAYYLPPFGPQFATRD